MTSFLQEIQPSSGPRRLHSCLLGMAILVLATPAWAGKPCGDAQSVHNGFLNQLDSYAAAVQNAVIEDATANSSFSFDFCGAPNTVVPGYVPHGDPSINGTGTLEINNNKITVHIDIGDIGVDRDFPSFHTHLYSLDSSYNTAQQGGSTICWAYTSPFVSGSQDDRALNTENWGGGWYTQHIAEVDASNNGGEWMIITNAYGGHFAVDADGHLIEWNAALHEEVGDPANGVEPNLNTIDASCNARAGRTLDNLDLVTGNSCNNNKRPNTTDWPNGRQAETYFQDQNGVSWLEAGGQLTADAGDHGLDLTTEYLFYHFADEGVDFAYGAAEGAAGGFIQDSKNGDRCDNWPPASYGLPHTHGSPMVPSLDSSVAVLLVALIIAVPVRLGFAQRSRRGAREP